METKWTPDALKEMITHPVYAGMGPYPAIVKDEQWLEANTRLIGEAGAKAVLESILARFRETFPDFRGPDARPYIRQAKKDAGATLRHLLAELRALVDTVDEWIIVPDNS